MSIMAMDREAAARAIVEQAKRARQPLPRSLWIVSIVVAVVCAGAFAIAWWTHDASAPVPPVSHPRPVAPHDGFGAGVIVGLVIGLLAGSALALRGRGRQPDR